MKLIDADALKSEAIKIRTIDGNLNIVFVANIDTAPTIDAVPVVRCAECVYHEACDTGWPCDITDDDDFCSHGAKMDKEAPT